ncbi:hypothetical protein ACVWYN_000015 [Pedobacter sp. UYP24]
MGFIGIKVVMGDKKALYTSVLLGLYKRLML